MAAPLRVSSLRCGPLRDDAISPGIDSASAVNDYSTLVPGETMVKVPAYAATALSRS
jgi:hypothetical protein